MSQTILVTGAAGFIASRTAAQLVETGHTVVGIDNMNDAYDARMKEHRREQLDRLENFTYLPIDIEDRRGLGRLFEDYAFDAVLNMAARAGVRYSVINPTVYLQTNAQGTLNLLELMSKSDTAKKMVLSSTSSLYAGHEMPFVESLPVNQPLSPYSASKKAAEAMAYSYHHLFEIDVTIARYFTVYGPAGRPDMSVFRFIKWIDEGTPITMFGDGEQTRDFTYVDDIASGTIAGMKPVGYEIVNLGGGRKPISMNYLIEQIEQRLGKKAKIDWQPAHGADMKHTSANIEKAKSLLDWEPTTDLGEGLDASIQWYFDNHAWASLVETGG
jgi:nucleoside-diphosphate-sugar epimerase